MFYNDPSQRHIQLSWIWTEDRQHARSVYWDKPKLATWGMEVRSEDIGTGSIRLGEIIIRRARDGTLLMRIDEL